jgi:hypothetical protein
MRHWVVESLGHSVIGSFGHWQKPMAFLLEGEMGASFARRTVEGGRLHIGVVELMKNHTFILLMAAVLLAVTGCERRAARGSLPNLVIPAACASEITLMHCDARVNPPKCTSARVTYRKGCERIVVHTAREAGAAF